MLTLILITKLVCEIALLSLLGRGLLAWLSGSNKLNNPFYMVLRLASQPFVRGVRCITPRFVLVQHHPLVAFCVLLLSWMVLTVAKINVCLQMGVSHCR